MIYTDISEHPKTNYKMTYEKINKLSCPANTTDVVDSMKGIYHVLKHQMKR